MPRKFFKLFSFFLLTNQNRSANMFSTVEIPNKNQGVTKMKTKQEQIEEMTCILTVLINCGGGCMTQYCRLVDNYAERLIEAGYGDVSEYKAEIKRLKSEMQQK